MSVSSKLWDTLTEDTFSNIDDEFLKHFRAPGAANKFVAWDPYENSTRYLKFLMFTTSQDVSDDFIKSYKKIQNIEMGNPVSINNRNCHINADYLAAVEEFDFLDDSNAMNSQEIKNIAEIGGGFGRTCHTFLTLFPNVESYTIIDLKPMLALSQRYLKKVIPEKFERIQFIDSETYELQEYLTPDLVINIDSFQEMPLSVIDDYMERIVSRSRYFYSKNAVAKYMPNLIGMPDLEPSKILDVFELGRCRDVIDIFNNIELDDAREKYLKAYNPSVSNWSMSHEMPMSMFPYFHHVLYSRMEGGN